MTKEEFIRDHLHEYPDGFFHWLELNPQIWNEFEVMALKMAKKRPRYSARTIVEVMRWNSDLRQHDVTFKLSNNMTPGMARLWMQKYGKAYPKFFSLHST